MNSCWQGQTASETLTESGGGGTALGDKDKGFCCETRFTFIKNNNKALFSGLYGQTLGWFSPRGFGESVSSLCFIWIRDVTCDVVWTPPQDLQLVSASVSLWWDADVTVHGSNLFLPVASSGFDRCGLTTDSEEQGLLLVGRGLGHLGRGRRQRHSALIKTCGKRRGSPGGKQRFGWDGCGHLSCVHISIYLLYLLGCCCMAPISCHQEVLLNKTPPHWVKNNKVWKTHMV